MYCTLQNQFVVLTQRHWKKYIYNDNDAIGVVVTDEITTLREKRGTIK